MIKAYIFISLLIFTFFRPQNNIIRLRIIPNSNNYFDINIKNEVKEYTLNYLENIKVNNYDDYLNILIKNENSLENNLHNIYKDINVDIIYTYPDHKKGIYDSSYYLYIKIGDASGDNFWASIYPEYIIGDESVKYESIFYNIYMKIKDDKIGN